MLSVRIERMLRALGRSIFIVGTNELKREALSDQELVTTYKEQGGVERGFRFLKDPLFPTRCATSC